MNTLSGFLLAAWCVVGASTANVQNQAAPWQWPNARVPDLGFDLDRAQVIRVTSLEKDGKGSLGEAMYAEGPRLVIFDVAGVIDLGEKNAKIQNDELIVAGQTAPSPGITLIKGGLSIGASRVLLQHHHTPKCPFKVSLHIPHWLTFS